MKIWACKKCGHCCRAVILKPGFTDKTSEFINAWGSKQNLVMNFPEPCKHLQKDNTCGIWETRPEICREYECKNGTYTTLRLA